MKRLLLFSFGFLWPVSLLADFQTGVDAYNRGDYATAYREFLPLARQGDAKARYNLGWMYYNGKGVPRDYAEAIKWYRLVAEQGLAEAQNNLGVMYDNGLGVPQDYAEAVRWYRLAAEQGVADAQYNLERCITTPRALRRITRRPCGGIASPPSRELP